MTETDFAACKKIGIEYDRPGYAPLHWLACVDKLFRGVETQGFSTDYRLRRACDGLGYDRRDLMYDGISYELPPLFNQAGYELLMAYPPGSFKMPHLREKIEKRFAKCMEMSRERYPDWELPEDWEAPGRDYLDQFKPARFRNNG